MDCRPFIGFMLDAIANSLYKYIDVATETATKPEEVGIRDNVSDTVNDTVNKVSDDILRVLRSSPRATAQKIALMLGVSESTIKRHLKALREGGQVRRIGSDKSGHWEVVGRIET